MSEEMRNRDDGNTFVPEYMSITHIDSRTRIYKEQRANIKY